MTAPGPVGPYVLMTAARDERPRLPALLAAIEAQEQAPALWLLVDDRSTDGTGQWLQDVAASRPWLLSCTAPETDDEYFGDHVAKLKRWGLEQLLAHAADRGVEPAVVGVLDADITIGPEHYRALLEAFARDPRLGVASSRLRSLGGSDDRPERSLRTDLPRGATQTFRRECLAAIGGLPPYCGYDGAANVKARLAGWTCQELQDVVARHDRPTGGRFGLGAGFARKGRYAWFLGHHPGLVALRVAAYATWSPRPSAGFARGWLGAALRGAPRCPDLEVRDYYRNERIWEYVPARLRRARRAQRVRGEPDAASRARWKRA